ncbi:hypothetical protein PIB30_093163 [Stylosanthes scabra]|uniref:PB1-like domain-containing protein n=1 Tax=Stylosanthes scabra TaxID=79078 RepID=A0ABU6XXL6_9FABA|nr:hypothetical protein [Stylosanthes scabra]
MDINLVCFYDLEEFVKEVGYEKWEKLLWHDLSDLHLDTDLHEIKGDAKVNAMRGPTSSLVLTYRRGHAHATPVNSEHYWTSTSAPKTLPPPIKRPSHPPAMKRRVDVVAEMEMNANKVRKTFEVTCNRCGALSDLEKGVTECNQKVPSVELGWFSLGIERFAFG